MSKQFYLGRFLKFASAPLALALTIASGQLAVGQTVRNYDVNRATAAPAIDGIVTAGEWDAAAAGAGDWRELRNDESDVDTEGNQFRMLWDDTNLYILYETNFATYFQPIDKVGNPNPNISFGEDNLNLYIDPNTNGDPNFTTEGVEDNNIDGYQFAFNQYEDPDGGVLVSTNADRQGVGFFTEAHVNTPFGDNGFWNDVDKDGTREGADVTGAAMQDIVVAQKNGAGGGVIEMVFPWANFNALEEIEVNVGTAEEPILEMQPTGLRHTSAPINGEQWFFNMSRINGDVATQGTNFLPIWNWHPGQSFAPRPHGTITFVSADALGGDTDGDGDVDGEDFLAGQRGEDFPGFFAQWEPNFGTTPSAATAVPEPSLFGLALVGLTSLAGLRRRVA